MPPKNQRPADMPKDTWPITKDDKIQIQELGRKLHEWLHNEFKGKDRMHLKIVVGAFNYVMGLQEQKTKLIGDDFLLVNAAVNSAKLNDQIEEPFTVEPDMPEPTIEERRAFLQGQLAELDKEEQGNEVAEASPAPSASATPPAEAPQGAVPSNFPMEDGPETAAA